MLEHVCQPQHHYYDAVLLTVDSNHTPTFSKSVPRERYLRETSSWEATGRWMGRRSAWEYASCGLIRTAPSWTFYTFLWWLGLDQSLYHLPQWLEWNVPPRWLPGWEVKGVKLTLSLQVLARAGEWNCHPFPSLCALRPRSTYPRRPGILNSQTVIKF